MSKSRIFSFDTGHVGLADNLVSIWDVLGIHLVLIGVASGRVIVVDELTSALDTNVILLTVLLAVLTDMSRSTLRTLHCRFPLIHTFIMQRRL
jgi:hypothetical protein